MNILDNITHVEDSLIKLPNYIFNVPMDVLLAIFKHFHPSSFAMVQKSCKFFKLNKNLFNQSCIPLKLNPDHLDETISLHVAIELKSISYIEYLLDNNYSICIESNLSEILSTNDHKFITYLVDPHAHCNLLEKHIEMIIKNLNAKTILHLLSQIPPQMYYNLLFVHNRFDIISLIDKQSSVDKNLLKSIIENYDKKAYSGNISMYKYMVTNGLFISKEHLIKAVFENDMEHIQYMENNMLKSELQQALIDIKELKYYSLNVTTLTWLSEHDVLQMIEQNIPKSFSQAVYLASINKFENILGFLYITQYKQEDNTKAIAQLVYYSCMFNNYSIFNHDLFSIQDIEEIKFVVDMMNESDLSNSIDFDFIDQYLICADKHSMVIDKYIDKIAKTNRTYIIDYYLFIDFEFSLTDLLRIYLAGNISMFEYICEHGKVKWNKVNGIHEVFVEICKTNNKFLIKFISDKLISNPNTIKCIIFLNCLFKYSTTETIKEFLQYIGAEVRELYKNKLLNLIFRYRDINILKYFSCFFDYELEPYCNTLYYAYENSVAAAEYGVSQIKCIKTDFSKEKHTLYSYCVSETGKEFIKWINSKIDSS